MAVVDHVVCGVDDGLILTTAINSIIDRYSNVSGVPTISLFGDSFAAYDRFSDAGNNYQDAVIQAGVFSFLRARLGRNINVTNFAGVGGDQFSDMRTRLTTDILDVGTDEVWMQGGVNDIYGFDRTAEDMFDDVEFMCDAMIANGQKVMLLICYPQLSTRGGYSTAKTIKLNTYNKLVSDYIFAKEGVIGIDVFSFSVDQSDNNSASARATYALGTDKIHLAQYGTYKTGLLCEQAQTPIRVPTSNNFKISPIEGGDYGDLNFSNFNNTGGTAGTGMSGVVPTGWVIKRQSGEGTMVGAQNAAGLYELDITKSVAGTSSVYRIQSNDLKANFSGGENVEVFISMSIDTVLDIEELRCYWYNDNSVDPFFTVDWGRSINGFTVSDTLPIDDLLIRLAPSTILDAPLTNVWLFIDIRMKGSGTGKATLKNVRIMDVV